MIERIKKSFYTQTQKYQNYVLILIGNVSNSFVQWLIINFLSKAYGTALMGEYAFVLSWIMPFYSFFQFQLRNIFVTDQDNEIEHNQYFTIRVTLDVLFLIVINIIGYLFYSEYIYLFYIISTVKFLEMISDLIYGYFQKIQDHHIYGKQLILRSVLVIIAIFTVYLLELNFKTTLIIIFFPYLLILVRDIYLSIIYNSLLKFGKIKFNKKNKELLVTGLISGIAVFIIYFNSNLPKYFIEKYDTKLHLGIYSGVFYILVLSRVLIQALAQFSLPSLSKLKDVSYEKYRRRIRTELLLVLSVSLLLFIIVPFSDYLLPLMYNNDFKDQELLLSIILTGGIFFAMTFILNNVVNSLGYFRYHFPINFSVFLIAITANFLLVKTYGLYGAAVSFVITSFSQFLILVIVCNYLIKKDVKVNA